ncbi:hypothetical protein ACFV84_38330 [Kitasatospora sp. NPDC059811]|uniref:hypothetical protein n=1 Tax=Streptomycetaceae TaxID=2062 RepID=UPI000ADBB3DD|nr:hypothetical protein [Streptomyces sp. MJM8645]
MTHSLDPADIVVVRAPDVETTITRHDISWGPKDDNNNNDSGRKDHFIDDTD